MDKRRRLHRPAGGALSKSFPAADASRPLPLGVLFSKISVGDRGRSPVSARRAERLIHRSGELQEPGHLRARARSAGSRLDTVLPGQAKAGTRRFRSAAQCVADRCLPPGARAGPLLSLEKGTACSAASLTEPRSSRQIWVQRCSRPYPHKCGAVRRDEYMAPCTNRAPGAARERR